MKKSKQARTWAFSIALTLASVCTVYAEENKLLTTSEIIKMVSGNTLSGVFGEKKTRYAQRVHANGIAVIHVEGSPIRLSPWFVKEPNSYCEDWDKDGIYCYQINLNTKTGERNFVYSDGSPSPMINLQEGFHPITFK